MEVFAIPAFRDNYIWALVAGTRCIVVDPGDAAPVLHFLAARQLDLCAVLITHRHHDHVDGLPALKAARPAPVFGPGTIAGVSQPVGEGDHIAVPGFPAKFEVSFVPGHTEDHLAYRCEQRLFCGDTLFAAGCGRLMGGSAAQLHQSLQRLAGWPPETLVYCTHEYTLSNLRFAQAVEPDNAHIKSRIARCQALRAQGLATLPSTLAEELLSNPFLRCAQAAVQASIRQHGDERCESELDYFAALRRWKDRF